MRSTSRSLLCRSVFLSFAIAPVVSAQQFTLQHTNSISLSSQFFGADTINNLPSSGYGSNPISVAFDGTSAYVGGINNTNAPDSVGIVKVENVLTGTTSLTPLAGTQLTGVASFRGWLGLASTSGSVYAIHDNGPSASVIRQFDAAGNQGWSITTSSMGGYTPQSIAIDPLADNGSPALGLLGASSGRRVSIRASDGTVIKNQSNGPIVNTNPFTGGNNRGLAFSSTGAIASINQKAAGYGLRDTQGGTNWDRFTDLLGTAGQISNVADKGSEQTNNPGQDIEILEGLSAADLLVFNIRGALDATTSVNVTANDGSVSAFATRPVHIRNRNGTATGVVQTALLGGEDGIGSNYTGVAKGFAVGKDANNNPVLFVLALEERKLDVYSLEPTWISGGGTWSDNANWLAGLNPNSALQNAKFANTGGSITIDDARTTKNLKLESANSYTFSGAGTLTLDGPDAWGSQIQVLNGSHTISVPVVLSKSANFTVNNAADTLNITGDISAAGKGVTKRGAGTAVVKNLRLSALAVRGGTLAFATNGTPSGVSRTADLVVDSSTLDLRNNGLAIDYVDGNSPIDTINAQVQFGYNNGNWNGTSIRSSTAAANTTAPNKGAIAIAEVSDLGGTAPALFSEVTTDSSTLLLMYTLAGDANLDRKVNTLDFNMLAGNFNTGTKWTQGNFNYDTSVDSLDFNVLASNYGSTYTPPAAPTLGSVVPEPASMGILSIGLSALALRRRK